MASLVAITHVETRMTAQHAVPFGVRAPCVRKEPEPNKHGGLDINHSVSVQVTLKRTDVFATVPQGIAGSILGSMLRVHMTSVWRQPQPSRIVTTAAHAASLLSRSSLPVRPPTVLTKLSKPSSTTSLLRGGYHGPCGIHLCSQ
eukprot:1194569-Prorocentrum_minimum.AAC.2